MKPGKNDINTIKRILVHLMEVSKPKTYRMKANIEPIVATVKTDNVQPVNPSTQLTHENMKFILFVVTRSFVSFILYLKS
jgi:hypothetical protein